MVESFPTQRFFQAASGQLFAEVLWWTPLEVAFPELHDRAVEVEGQQVVWAGGTHVLEPVPADIIGEEYVNEEGRVVRDESHSAKSPYWDPFNRPLREGFTEITEKEFIAATKKQETR